MFGLARHFVSQDTPVFMEFIHVIWPKDETLLCGIRKVDK